MSLPVLVLDTTGAIDGEKTAPFHVPVRLVDELPNSPGTEPVRAGGEHNQTGITAHAVAHRANRPVLTLSPR